MHAPDSFSPFVVVVVVIGSLRIFDWFFDPKHKATRLDIHMQRNDDDYDE